MAGFFDWMTGARWKRNVEKEMKEQREQNESNNQRHHEEMKQNQDDMKKAERRHRTEMKQKQEAMQQAELKHRSEIQQNQDEMSQKQEEMQQAQLRHRTEMKQLQDEMKQKQEDTERKHQDELEKMKRGFALEGKISRKRIKLFKKMPGESDNFPKDVRIPGRLFISLFGETGTGKTSLINSLKYTIEGKLKSRHRVQSAHPKHKGAHTIESLEVVLTEHLSVIDNRGINCEKTVNDTQQEDVIRQMEGIYKKGKVTWQSLAPAHENKEDKRSYCSVMVFSAEHPNVVRAYRSFINHLREWQGRFPLAVITHVDKASCKDVKMALQSGGVGEIYEVANITTNESDRDNISPEHQIQLQELLERSFKDGDSIFLRRQEIESGD